jgi:sulfite dehydrogenase (cytochrome) subunit B
MKHSLLFALALLFGGGVALAGNSAPPKATVSISLPGDVTASFKPGAGVATAQAYCLSCHSSAYVAMQPVLTTAQWTAEVAKMKNVYGASIPDDQVSGIVAYLVAQYGKP